jgi:hypothetical protein
MKPTPSFWKPHFDPTIHLGHLVNFLGIVFGIGTIYAYMISDIRSLKAENARQDHYIERIERDYKESFLTLSELQRNEVNRLRDEMNAWFLKLSDKLDQKADKR